ncbi:response regulator [Calidifontimicrobium sp. SYSU G02091]|uniref:response regulator n=1 Tax=Calidifontimicrobium sp. SYSU G02091 TaxID=2926421 RepID=UPI001F534786|nr:response regulator [Calidifontimicrobium sp. SYSU G02091]MCI1192040.1 response regulator [Calidifontimicrobium sp. SYSU G02091]
MKGVDRDIVQAKALLVDPNPTSRSIMAAQLREIGVGSVTQCGRLLDARRMLEHRTFDIVLCESHFPDETTTGQQLLDDLRRAQLLPFSTVFVMITAEATYDKVAEAAEAALDSYLLKPHTAAALAERVQQARARKKALHDIFGAIEAGDLELAAQRCMKRFHDRAPYWLYAARIGAELLLRLSRPDAAQKLYEAVIAAKTLPWARLGVARALAEGGAAGNALRTLEALIADEPAYADAYDVMGRLQFEQGQVDAAMATFRQAAELTPSSVGRLQKHGVLAFYAGELADAARALERAVALGIGSRQFDAQTLVLLGFLRLAERDGKGLQRCLEHVEHLTTRDGADTVRLARFTQVLRVLQALLRKQLADAVARIKRIVDDSASDDFDVEAACNLLTTLAHLGTAEIELPDADAWVDAVALRHCASKGITELLARAAAHHPPLAERVRAGHARVLALAEAAMAHKVAGDVGATVRELLAHTERTRNPKLLETAAMTLKRYRDDINEADALQRRLDALRPCVGRVPAAPRLGAEGGRQAGGIALRTPLPAAAAATAPAALA